MEVAQPFPRGRIKPTASSNKSSSVLDKVSGGSAAFHKKSKKNEQDFLFGPSEKDSVHRPTSDVNIKRRKVESSSKEVATTVASISVNPLGGGAVIPSDPVKRRPAIIESVAFSKLVPKHTKVLGIVRDVAADYAIISLPNMLTGFIRRNSSSSDPPIHHQISKNTVLAVSIQATAVEHVKNEATPKRRIEVSIHPRHMNQGLNSDILHDQMRIRGIIHSKEDHGCIVHVHIPGVTCFLPYQNVHNYTEEDNYDEEESYDSDASADEDDDDSATSINHKQKRHKHDDSINIRYSLRPGRIYDFVISKITRDRSTNSNSNGASRIMIQLSLPGTKDAAQLLEPVPSMAQAERNQLASHTLKTLSPGMLVKCYIEGYAKNGLLISFFLGLFRASIEANHMGGYYIEEGKAAVDWRKLFRDSSIRHVIGRIIVTDPSSKIIRVSLLPHLLNLSIPAASELPTVGTVIQNATVVRIDKGIGALLAIPQEYTPAVAQPCNQLALEEEEEEELGNEESDDDNNLEHHQWGRKRKKPTDAPTWSRVQSLYSIPQHLEASKVRCVYVHISKASDTNTASEGKKDPLLGAQLLKEMEFSKQFKVGSTIPAVRILSTQSWVENIASGATAPSIVEASVLSHSDIKPGVLYRSVPILSIGTYGIMVSLGQNIKAVCPFLHMYDKVPASSENLTTSRAFAKLFAVGKKITVRCLDVDPESKRCNVTHKPSLVKDTGCIVCSYDNLPPPHEVVKGYVSKCVSDGIMVSFYNNIYGWCSAKSLQRDLGVEDVTESYKLGDVVKCRIIKGNFRDNRWYLSVSLDITDRAISAATSSGGTNNEDSSLCTNEETLKSKLPPGTVLPSGGKIVQMVNSQRSSAGRLFCGYAMVLYKEIDRGISFECRLPYELVFDSPPNDDSPQPIPIQTRLDNLVAEKLCIGKKLETEAVVLGIHSMDGATLPFISIKPRIVDAAVASASDVDDKEKRKGKSTLILPSSAADLYVGANVIGYVYHHDERHGAFIRFLNKLTGIVPKSKRGLELPLYHTITFTVGELDPTKSPPQIFLRKSKGRKNKLTSSADSVPPIRVGEFLGDVEVRISKLYTLQLDSCCVTIFFPSVF
jgi:ribosomal protein S1